MVTEQGDYVCEHVVNAGGAYAHRIGQWTGLDLPITCMTHHYLVTETVPEFADLDRELPVVHDDAKVSGYVRMEQKSGLVGIIATPTGFRIRSPPCCLRRRCARGNRISRTATAYETDRRANTGDGQRSRT